jgi:beta-phosphoglucomutase
MIKCVIFDLDGVLTNTTDEHFGAWCNLFEKHFNIQLDKQLEVKTKGVSRRDSLEVLLNYYGLDISEEDKQRLMDEKNENYRDLINNIDESKLMDGVLDLLMYFKKNSIKIALGSASRNGETILERLKIKDYFDYIVDPSLVKGKPYPDIFLAARDFFNLSSKECIGFEDAVSGIKAIKAADMYAVGVGEENLDEADVQVASLVEFNDQLREKIFG